MTAPQIVAILAQFPDRFAEFSPFIRAKFTGRDVANLLIERPELVKRVLPYMGKMTGSDVRFLMENRPDLWLPSDLVRRAGY
jgi:hypothetical protein